MGNRYHGRSKSSPYPALSILRPCLAPASPSPATPPPPQLHLHTLGLCDLCPSLEKQLLVFPGHKCGSLQLVVSSPVVRGGWVGGLVLPVDSETLPSLLPKPRLFLPTIGPGKHKAWHFICSVYHQCTSE